jgi:UDP-glucose 4-epimerase
MQPNSKCLVTGGAGFIGAHVVRELLHAGHQVVVLDDLSGGFKDNVPAQAELVVGDICNHLLVNNLFEKHRFDQVYHLAAYAAEGLSHFIKRFNYSNNLVGSVNLINASINFEVKTFVFTSSIAVYGANQLPMREDMIPQPEDSYGVAKLAVEQELKCSHEMFGLDYVIFRPHNVYGEFQNIGDRYRNVIGIFMNQIMQGRPLTIFGDGTQTRAFSYVGPVAATIAKSPSIVGARNQIFNIGADQPYSVNQLAETVGQVMGTEAQIEYLPARNEVLHAYSDHSHVQSVFGVQGDDNLVSGLQRMATWALKHGARSTNPFTQIEIARNMPPSWKDFSNQTPTVSIPAIDMPVINNLKAEI